MHRFLKHPSRGQVTAVLEGPEAHQDAILPHIESMLGRAAQQRRHSGGTKAEAYRMARIAEQLINALLHDDFHARQAATELDSPLLVG